MMWSPQVAAPLAGVIIPILTLRAMWSSARPLTIVILIPGKRVPKNVRSCCRPMNTIRASYPTITRRGFALRRKTWWSRGGLLVKLVLSLLILRSWRVLRCRALSVTSTSLFGCSLLSVPGRRKVVLGFPFSTTGIFWRVKWMVRRKSRKIRFRSWKNKREYKTKKCMISHGCVSPRVST